MYDAQGERLHTTYVAAEPAYGKQRFKARLDREISHVKHAYQEATMIGLADGASDNWTYLKRHVTRQIVDFYHVTEYLASVALAVSKKREKQEAWLKEACHKLKHKKGAASRLLKAMKALTSNPMSKETREKLESAITYFTHHKAKMSYATARELNYPIGSGVTEAGCKAIVKQRLCKSGMKWKEKGAGFILSLRTLSYSTGRWDQFWNKVDQYGF